MKRNMNKYLPGILNGITGIGVILISFLIEYRFSMSRGISRPLGFFMVAAGMLLAVWAAVHIKGAILGEVAPKLDVLVKTGPYRFVRHPVYLGMTISFVGVAVSLRSWSGMIIVFLLFLPTEIFRAKLEEKALLRLFGSEWENYGSQTGFILPFIRKK